MNPAPLPGLVAAVVKEAMLDLAVPGVAVGVLHDGEVYAEAFGVTNVDHPLPVTVDTLFQVGSTSKTFTATAIMQLLEAGSIDLDATVRTYLPGFRLQSEADAARLTLRDLLTHHGGFVGDVFANTGRGADALEKVVDRLADQPQVLPAGVAFSYSNAGFYTLGRIVEVISGLGFERYIRERVLQPLGMGHSFYFPEETIVHRVVTGHVRTPEGARVATPWAVPRSIAPGGGLISDVPDQLAWAAFHMHDGTTPLGDRLLTPESLAEMQRPQRPAGSMCPWIGLSWMLTEVAGVQFVAHGGATNGQLSAFEFAPAANYACTVLTNSDSGRGLRPTVTEACRRAFLGLDPQDPVSFSGDLDLSSCTGRYSMTLATLHVRAAEGSLVVAEEPVQLDGRIPPLPPDPVRLVMTAPGTGAITEGPRRGETAEFLRGRDGAVEFVRWDGRLAARLA